MARKNRQLTRAELRAMATPGLMAHKVGPDGRARLEQLAPESDERRRSFAMRLTNQDDVNEASEGSK
jgi:hypothetical protein